MTVQLIIIRHSQWETFAERVTNAQYETVDDVLDSIGLNHRVDAVAGMFFSKGSTKKGLQRAIYADEALALPALREDGSRDAKTGVGLAKHEKGHEEDVPLNDHPTGILAMLGHAYKVGFDYRAGTRLLRFNKKGSPPGFASWWSEQQRLLATGKLMVQSAPPAP